MCLCAFDVPQKRKKNNWTRSNRRSIGNVEFIWLNVGFEQVWSSLKGGFMYPQMGGPPGDGCTLNECLCSHSIFLTLSAGKSFEWYFECWMANWLSQSLIASQINKKISSALLRFYFELIFILRLCCVSFNELFQCSGLNQLNFCPCPLWISFEMWLRVIWCFVSSDSLFIANWFTIFSFFATFDYEFIFSFKYLNNERLWTV